MGGLSEYESFRVTLVGLFRSIGFEVEAIEIKDGKGREAPRLRITGLLKDEDHMSLVSEPDGDTGFDPIEIEPAFEILGEV